MNEDRYHELVLAKLDSLSEELRGLRQECHATFARQSDLVRVSSDMAKLDLRLEQLEKSAAQLQGARGAEMAVLKWILGIVAAVAGVLVAAWLMSK